MRLRDHLWVWSGESVLVALGVLRVFCCFPGVRALYRTLLIRLVINTRLFDEQYYRENNPDIAESRVNELFHYVAYGDQEGRAPMAFFDPICYREAVGGWTNTVNSLLHFSLIGRYRRISPSPWFDVEYYLSNNKDVARAGVDPLLHFLKWGGQEGRSPCAHFDSAYYLRRYQDVLERKVNPLLHYLSSGRYEGRQALPDGYGTEAGTQEMVVLHAYPGCEEWQALEAPVQEEPAVVDVIVPVYKGKAETLRCLFSVLSSKCQTRYQLIVINDASPDEGLVDELRSLAERGFFALLENDSNKGFVHTVNRGMGLHAERDVVLLNSDTEVYSNWLDRLVSSARRTDRVGTVTPLSNNATICSYPKFLHDNPFPLEIDYRDLDSMLAQTNTGVVVEAPTGVGFCMYISRDCLKDVGLFDEKTFGRGYGEENDFCQRALSHGWRNLIAADVFVRHWGSVSFQGEKARLASHAMKMMMKKHPRYLEDVTAFIKREPLAKIFEHIDWARLLRLRRERNVLLISHGRGGGTEKRVQEDIERFMAEGAGVYLMRPIAKVPGHVCLSHPMARELPNVAPIAWADFAVMKQVISELRITEVISHSFVDSEPQAPRYMQNLVRALNIAWTMNLHDYEMICPRINLVDSNGLYCGEPDEAGCNRCLAANLSSFDVTDIREWRSMRRNAMHAASRIVVPDKDMGERLLKYYPEVDFKVCPHEKLDVKEMLVREPLLEPSENLRIVVIGAINKLKGYEVLLRCAKNSRMRRLPLEFLLLGYSQNDRQLEEAGVRITGKYKDSDVVARLHGMRPHLVWLPSIAPESYSYTLSVALAAECPIMAFDIGAIARRLKEYGMEEWILPLEVFRQEGLINDALLTYRNRHLCSSFRNEDSGNAMAVVAAAAFD